MFMGSSLYSKNRGRYQALLMSNCINDMNSTEKEIADKKALEQKTATDAKATTMVEAPKAEAQPANA
jgi:hypothetical protein